MKVNMTPNPLDVVTIHASQGDSEARQWEFELHNNGELIDTSDVTEQMFFKAYKGGTEQILPENTSTPTTSPFIGDIRYPQGLLTDQEFTYRQSPTEEDGLAKITDIKGNTLVWNQLVQNGNFASINAWSSIMGTRTASNNELTYQPTSIGNAYYENQVLQQGFNVPTNHVLFLHCETYAPYDNGFYMSIRTNLVGQSGVGITNVTPTPNSWSSFSKIAKLTNTMTDIAFYWSMDTRYTTNDTVKLRNVYIIDLTQMFGQTKAEEILAMGQDDGVAYFRSLYPLPYYQYDSGSLLSFRGEGLKTVGFNQWDEEYEDGVYRVYNASGDGSKQSISGYTRCKNLVRILPNQRYYLKKGNRTIDGYVAFYDGSGNYLGFDSVISYSLVSAEYIVFTSPSNAHFCTFYSQGSIKGTCLNIYDEELNGTYEPYTSSTTDLPTLTYFPNGMKSAGSVYDELTESKAITRIGAVDLGSLTWTKNTNYNTVRFITDNNVVPLAKLPSNNTETANIKSRYVAFPTNDLITTGKDGIALSSAGGISVRDSAYTSGTAEEFKTAMSGVYLYYELATPTETSFTTASLVTENAEIPLSNDDGTLIGKCTEELSAEPGFHDAKIKLADSDGECYSNKIQLHVERSPQ